MLKNMIVSHSLGEDENFRNVGLEGKGLIVDKEHVRENKWKKISSNNQ